MIWFIQFLWRLIFLLCLLVFGLFAIPSLLLFGFKSWDFGFELIEPVAERAGLDG